MYLGVLPWIHVMWNTLHFLDFSVCFLFQVREVFSYDVFSYILIPLPLPLLLLGPLYYNENMCQLNGIGSFKLSSAFWWGTDLGTKESIWQLPRVFMWFKVPQYGCHPESVSPGWSTITTSPLQETPKLASRAGPGSYQIAAFSLGPHVSEILCVPF